MTANKPAWWTQEEARLACLAPADLPTTPWVFRHTPPGKAGNIGGPFVTVHNNETFLRNLKREVSEGPGGPRALVVMDDLRQLHAVMESSGGRMTQTRKNP